MAEGENSEGMPPIERTEVLPPTRLVAGKYRLGRMLGEGGMGAVYEAEHTGLGSRVAVKLLSERFANDPKSLTRFRREARAAAAVRHENIVAVTDTGTDEDGVPFLVMELLEGESLSALLRRYRVLPSEIATSITSQVLAGLSAAHAAGIVHRDLKPGNVFIARDGEIQRVKILDFGISKFGSSQSLDVTAEGAVVGTPHFMAPEQVRGQSDVDARIDLYATGVLLYRMVTGRLPFAANTPQELYEKILSGNMVTPRAVRPEVPAELEAIVLRAMNVDREQRFADAREFRDALLAATPLTETSALVLPTLPPLDTEPTTGPTVAQGGRQSSRPPSLSRPSAAPAKSVPPPASGTQPAPAEISVPAHVPPSGMQRAPMIAGAAVLVLAAVAGGAWIASQSTADGAADPGHPEPDRETTTVQTAPPVRFAIQPYKTRAEVEAEHEPFVRYLSEQLGRPAELVLAGGYDDVASMLVRGDVELAALSPMPYLKAKRLAPGIEPLATPVTEGGSSSYQGLLLARADSDIAALTDLTGKVFCYVNETSSSGYLYPRAVLRRAGIDPDAAFRATRFTGDHVGALRALSNGACDGAAVSADLLHESGDHGMAPTTFRILASTPPIQQDAYVAAPNVPAETVEAMKRALLALEAGSPEAVRVLGPGNRIRGFVAVRDSDYDTAREIEHFLDGSEVPEEPPQPPRERETPPRRRNP